MNYRDVLKRLKEERQKICWSQREICQYLRMSQAQYCKIENGEQYLSYYEVRPLSYAGMDVYYIFTGRRASDYYIKEFESCNYIEVICLLESLFSIVTYHCALERSEFWKELYKELQYIRLLDAAKSFDNNIFLLLRNLLNYTQREMSGMLSIDIKKLRRLEKGECLPDSELLWRFYKEFYVSPFILLRDRKGLLYEAGWFLERIAVDAEDDIAALQTIYCKN